MNRNERRLLEEKIKSLNDDKYQLTDEHIEAVLAKAHDELLRRERVRIEKHEKRKSRLRRVVLVSAATVSLMVCCFAYSALAPVTVGSADNIVRRASIWINDTLHLGVTFTQPEDSDGGFQFNGKMEFATIEEAAEKLKTPIIYLGDAGDFHVDKVMAEEVINSKTVVTIDYLDDNQNCIHLDNAPIYEGSEIMFDADGQENVETALGTVYLSETEEGTAAIAVYQNRIITITAPLNTDEIVPILQSLNVLN